MSTEDRSVLVLLVASNAEPWLPDVLEGVRNQTHDEIEVLAVDNASTDRSRALLEDAFGAAGVVSLDRRVGYGRALAAALKVAAERGTAADAFLLLHDDAAMDPGSVEAMVAALARERVGIVGAKLVEWDAPETLQEVGLTTDRYGRLYNPLERGELDQGQHDGLKEVFFSSSAALLIAREVIERIGLFDLRYVALRDDFDLCWRARIAGYRSVVTTDARVRHACAAYRALRPSAIAGRVRYFSERNMLASLLKNYGVLHLAVALPVALAGSLANVVLFTATGRRDAARQTLSALQWNLAHLPSTLRARARSQRRRRVGDREVAKLMAGGAMRVRSYVERALEQVVGEPAAGIEEEGEGIGAERRQRHPVGDLVRAHPVGIGAALLVLVYLIGARHLYGSVGLAGADLAPFPSKPSAFFTEFFSGWRAAGTGGAGAASPAMFLAGLLSIVSFGSVRIAERLLVLSLLPLAAASAWRLAAALDLPARARAAAAVAYVFSPLALASFSQGRLPDLVLIAALPALLIPALRAAGFAPAHDWRSPAAGVIGLAVVASFSPWALPAVAGSAVLLALSAALAGRRPRALKTAVVGVAQALGATILLLPWSLELFKDGSPLGASRAGFGVPIADLVRLLPGGGSPIPPAIAWAFPGAAAAALAIGLAHREPVSRVLAMASTGAILVAWGVARGTPWIAPRPALPLALAAVGVAVLIGVAAEGLVPSLSSRSFGAFHLGFGALAIYGMVAVLAGVAFIGRGDLAGLTRSGELTPAFFEAETGQVGDYRVLWLTGTPRDLRADLSTPGGETFLSLTARRSGGGERYLERILASVLANRTEQAGRLLGPLGVRYVVLRSGIDPRVVRAFARQVDMRSAQRFRGSEILANQAWLPVAAPVTSQEWVTGSRGSSGGAMAVAASLPEDPGRARGLRRVRPGVFVGRIQPDARGLLLAEEFAGKWRAQTRGRAVAPIRSFGWAVLFPLAQADAGPVVVSWRGQGAHRLALIGEALLVLMVVAAWSRRAARERGER